MSAGLAGLLLLVQAATTVAVPYPALDGLEPAVERQLRDVQQRLAARVKDGGADASLFGAAGRVYHAYELFAAAEACYQNAQALAPGDFRWPYLLGLLYEKADRLEASAHSFERALDRPDKYYPALLHLARVYMSLGRGDDAARVLEPARRHSPEDPALLAVLGELALDRGQAAEAVDSLSGALARRPEATRLHYSLGMAYRALGRVEEARAHLAQAGSLGVRPRDPLLEQVLAERQGQRPHVLEGRRAYGAGDYASAAAAFRRALEAEPDSVPALVDLAAAETQLGRTEVALEHLQQAAALAPDNAVARYDLGALLVHLGRPAEAEPHLRAVLARAPQDAAARLTLARVLGATGRASEALFELERLGALEAAQCPTLLKLLEALRALPGEGLAPRAAALEERYRQDVCRP